MRKNMITAKSRVISIMLAAAMMTSFTGCEKKAEVVEGNTQAAETDTSAGGKTEADTADDSKASGDDDIYPEGESWKEKVEGSGSGYEYVDVDVSFFEQEDYNFVTTKVVFDTFDKDYIKGICDRAFDGGEVEVYDYNHKTKRVYEDEIEVYKQACEMAESVKKYNPAKLKGYICGFFHMDYDNAAEYPDYKAGTEEFDTSVITADMNKLISESESAPETIENDYSYQGYIGKIDGEEFYMYLGNRNLNEYYSAPDTTQMNGRVITFMRSDLESAFSRDNESVELESGETIDKQSDPDNPLFRKNCLLTSAYEGQEAQYFSQYETLDEPEAREELAAFLGETSEEYSEMISKSEDFLKKLGFTSYEYAGWEDILYWSNVANDKFMFGNGYEMSTLQKCEMDGHIVRFAIPYENTDMLPYYELQMDEYLDSGDAFTPLTYATVFVNKNGVLGCQIVNPVTVLEKEEVNGLIDPENVKDIVRQCVDDKSMWNQPKNNKIVLFKVSEAVVTAFPIHSKDNPDEYTFVPCYAIYEPGYNDNPLPFLLINAIDGSIIKAEEELDNYPAGWQNGNLGYENHKAGTWPKLNGNKTDD